MNSIKKNFVIILMLSAVSTGKASDLFGGVNFGLYGGLGFDAYASAHNFADGLPLGLRLGFGYSSFDPGNATDARRIFINNNQGGTVQERGTLIRFSFDFVYPIRLLNLPEANLYIGPRYADFKGNFKFIGDNEDFDVTSNHWGLGLGLDAGFSMNSKIDFTMIAGADYYFSSTLYGHDTSYSPNGENENPREDYQYNDADQAINQPSLEPRFMIGLRYKFGK
jgi:hypothetical protein